jgi:hypothetical protein
MDAGRRRFAEKMMGELRRRGADPVTLDEEQFRLEVGGSRFLMLENAYSEWQQAPRLRRGRVLRTYAAVFASGPEEPAASVDEARPNLLVYVREQSWFSTLALRYADARDGKGPAFTHRPLNDHLALEVVYDHPSSIASLAPETLEEWGMELDEAVSIGRSNLRERTPGTFEEVRPGVFASPWHDNYDAARLVLTELISRLDVRGDPVALLPHRDALLVAGSDDADALGHIAATAEPLLDDSRAITGRAFVWRDGAWEWFMPPEDHPQHRLFRRLLRLSEAREYDDQRAALDDRHEASGTDVFVASLSLIERPDNGEVLSFCSWAQDIPTLLPRADAIAFVRTPSGESVAVPWEAAVAVVGDLMAPQGLLPERWRVVEFPDEAQRAELARYEIVPPD